MQPVTIEEEGEDDENKRRIELFLEFDKLSKYLNPSCVMSTRTNTRMFLLLFS